MTSTSSSRRSTAAVLTVTTTLTVVLGGVAYASPGAGARAGRDASALKIAADSTDAGAFGIAVDLTQDGSTAIVGAQQHNTNRGGAYVFQKTGGTWTKSADLTRGAPEFGDSYGNAVAISSDATWAMIGEVGWRQLTGRVFVLHDVGGRWRVVARLKAPHGSPYTHFGDSISMSSAGDEAVIGQLGAKGFVGRAYVYTRTASDTWTRSQRLTPHTSEQTDFGTSVSLSADGSTALVGANVYASGQGAAYTFRRVGEHWVRAGRLTAHPAVAGGNFGNSVALNADGTTAIVGSVYEGSTGAAYIYQSSAGGWKQTDRLAASGSQQFGSAVSLDAAGTTALVGAEASQVTGTAYLYTDDGTGWSLTSTMGPDVDDQAFFGVAVSLDEAGDEGLVGASYDDDGVAGQSGYGAVYVEQLP